MGLAWGIAAHVIRRAILTPSRGSACKIDPLNVGLLRCSLLSERAVGNADSGDDRPDTRHFIKGKTIKEIARDLKVSRSTVRGYCGRVRHPSNTSETFSPDRSLGDGKNSTRFCRAMGPSLPASN